MQGTLRGEVSLPSYLAFLHEAYHHVHHTVPLLRACSAALPQRNHCLREPLAFLGMVHVLEGTSVSLALLAAQQIQKPRALPDSAFSYLRSHGVLDREHTAHFEALMNRIEDPGDQADILHAARAFFHLYGDVFRSLPPTQPGAHGPQVRAKEVAA
ncbi:MAG: iron-containing redox enzyme family protein [Burkholderiales bacterium]